MPLDWEALADSSIKTSGIVVMTSRAAASENRPGLRLSSPQPSGIELGPNRVAPLLSPASGLRTA